MIYQIISPAAFLKTFIKDYTLLHFKVNGSAKAPVKPFPATTAHSLVFYIRGKVTAVEAGSGQTTIFPATAINGSQTRRFDFYLSPEFLMLSINFHPWALSKFLRLPLTEFVDQRIDAEAMLNPGIHILHEQLCNANSYGDIITIAEAYLRKRINNLPVNSSPIDEVIGLMAGDAILYTVEKLAGYACLSVSQFERRFVQQTGITPRFFARINRFHQAYLLKENNPHFDWLRIAVETGYYDYQHLARDFKQFSGVTPNSLLQAQANAPDKIFVTL